jgi:transglutaminase-like putative cysteine protease
MSFSFAFLASSHFLILLGVTGLFFTGELALLYLTLAVGSLILGVVSESRGGKGCLPPLLANLALVGIFILTLFSIFVLKSLPLQEIVHFLLAIQAVKLLSQKKGRDWLQLYLISFFNLIAATALSVELFTATIFVCYLITGPWVLVLWHLKGAIEASGKDPDKEVHLSVWPLFRLLAGMSGVLFFLTSVFFITLPRFGAGYFADLWASGSGVTGFSDRMSLGEVAQIKKNSAVAMRVRVDRPDLLTRKGMYWRGVALDLFDGRRWERSRTDLVPLRRIGETYTLAYGTRDRGSLVRQEILLEPTGSPALFYLQRPVALTSRVRALFLDPLGNLRAAGPFPFQISYEVLSSLDEYGEAVIGEYLQIPVVDPRIADLSREITQGIDDDINKARAMEQYLRDNYRYSLEGLPMGADPLALFLFDVRQGDCEYFSSALAIMLRLNGIPARVVNGYLGGDWNSYGEYYLIQHSNAHSWVEAYFKDRGWVTLDPTPAVPRRPPAAFFLSLAHFMDSLRLRWYRYVIRFGWGDQLHLFALLKRPDKWIHPGLPDLSPIEVAKWLGARSERWLGLGLALLIVARVRSWIRQKRFKGRAREVTLPHEATERYRRFLALARKKGLRKKPGETADEFSRVAGPLGNGLIDEFTALYQQARFSTLNDFADGLTRMDQILTELRQ